VVRLPFIAPFVSPFRQQPLPPGDAPPWCRHGIVPGQPNAQEALFVLPAFDLDTVSLHAPDFEIILVRARLGGFAREAACAARLLAAKPQSPPLQSNRDMLLGATSVSG